MSGDRPFKVLVTGFGAFLDVTKNPSFEIASRLPSSLPGDIAIVAHPDPLPAAYRPLLEISKQLLDQYDPDMVVHIGLAFDRTYFAIERSAERDGYHEVPDMERRVLLKNEGKEIWGKKSADRLATGLDLDAAFEGWKDRVRWQGGGKAKVNGKGRTNGNGNGDGEVDIRLSDDVGNYVCGLIYYATLANLAEKGKADRPGVFFHVPPLQTDEEVQKGVRVTTALIEALVEAYRA